MTLRLDPETELERLLDDLKWIDRLFEERQGLFGEWLIPASHVDQPSATEVENLWSGVAQQIPDLIADIEETEVPEAEAMRREIVIALQARVQALRADAEALDLRLAALAAGDLAPIVSTPPPAAGAALRVATWVSSTLMPLIKSLVAQVWNVVCALITPKHWSIKGVVGTPLLGLANVELEITFGK